VSALTREVEAFLAQLDVERRVSPHTLAAYRRDLALLLQHCTVAGVSEWPHLHGEQLRGFIAAQHRRGLGPKSLQRLLSACRSFFRYLLGQGLLGVDPSTGLRAPKAPRKLPQVLDADEMTQLVQVPGDSALDLRDRALLELFYSSGLRLAELCALRWRDLDAGDALLRVLGKGGKTRVVPVGSHALAALAALRTADAAGNDAPIFRGRGGAPISPRAVQTRVKLLAQRQGIWKRVHPHLIRHSCASHVLESSGDLRGVQELLGHADIATTQIYTHLDFGHLAKVYDAAHPRAKRRG
jgi:integrase/recombinase XerC